MILTFILWLFSRYIKRKNPNSNWVIAFDKVKNLLPKVGGIVSLIVILLLTSKCHAQNRELKYEILRNGSKVGNLHFTESTIGEINHLQMESNVKTRFVFTFTGYAKDEAVYYNGVLLRSSIYRKMNGREKSNKQHQAVNKQYIIHTGENSESTRNYPITCNMLSLYTKEPSHLKKVYSDNFETYVVIQKTEDHKYKIIMPDGNYYYYYYKDGVANRIEVHHSLYSVNIVLVNP